MKRTGFGRCKLFCVFLILLAAGTLLCCAAADRDEDSAALMDTADMILARQAAVRLNLRGEDGNPLQVHSAPELEGRGAAAEGGAEPDYTGVVGFAALPRDPAIAHYSLFDRAAWVVPVYREENGEYTDGGNIDHKLPLVVTGQKLEKNGEGYSGYLEAVRLDTGELCVLDVRCFVTVPYWFLPVAEAAEYGYAIAVYRETPGSLPKMEDGTTCTLHDGTRVLIPAVGALPDRNPAPETLKVQGVLFDRERSGKVTPRTVYFREEDLVLNY